MSRMIALVSIGSVLAVAGFAQLAQKEHDLLFRVVPGTASWYDGLPQGVVESHRPAATAKGKTEHVHNIHHPLLRNKILLSPF